ncbi:MAG: VWA domain-containing protein, partial [Polyangiaceae bacterium]
ASCDPGIEVFAPQRGDSPAGTGGPTAVGLITSTNVPASGGTPTAATIRGLTGRLSTLPGKTFAILATDGGPNCNMAATCDATSCIPNIEGAVGCSPGGASCCDPASYGPLQCLDGQDSIDAVTALSAAGVPTYVVGVPGSVPYAALLDALAVAGGTARAGSPRYYRVDSTDAAAFASALAQVAAKITATCILKLGMAPPDPTHVNVYLDDVVVPSDPANGWTLDGSTVTLTGTTCDRVLSGDVLDLRVIAGCPTVPAK